MNPYTHEDNSTNLVENNSRMDRHSVHLHDTSNNRKGCMSPLQDITTPPKNLPELHTILCVSPLKWAPSRNATPHHDLAVLPDTEIPAELWQKIDIFAVVEPPERSGPYRHIPGLCQLDVAQETYPLLHLHLLAIPSVNSVDPYAPVTSLQLARGHQVH